MKSKRRIHRSAASPRVIAVAVALVFLAVGLLLLAVSRAATGLVTAEPESGTITAPAAVVSDTTASGGKDIKFGVGTTCGQVGGTCTAAQVALHNSASDCWMIYLGSYYNVTPFIPTHKGGQAVFNSTTCGHDVAPYLDGTLSSAGRKHVHANAAYADLAKYKIGPVK